MGGLNYLRSQEERGHIINLKKEGLVAPKVEESVMAVKAWEVRLVGLKYIE